MAGDLLRALGPAAAALPAPRRVRLFLATEPDLDHSTVYRLPRLLAEFPVRSVATGGSTLTTRSDASTITYGPD